MAYAVALLSRLPKRLSELVGHRPGAKAHRVVAATHDAELIDLLAETYEAFHLTDSLSPEGLVFEYRLKGASVVNRALERAGQLDRLRHAAASGNVDRVARVSLPR